MGGRQSLHLFRSVSPQRKRAERGPKPEVDLMRLQFANPFSQRINTTYVAPPHLWSHNRAEYIDYILLMLHLQLRGLGLNCAYT